MTPRYQKLKALLLELFQLNQPDLDFGFYRVMHAKRDEVTQFLDKDLLPQVQEAFRQYQSADKTELQRALAEAAEQARGLGVDPETTQKVKDIRARLATEAVDLDALEAEVYDHLYNFFRRYYSEGDFLSKRVYKPGVYAIPYEGEEVKLHWANADQYYIKSSEYLRDYSFRLSPDDGEQPMRVHFRLMDAAEGEHGNIKEQAGEERRFKLAVESPTVVENGELVVRFTYQPIEEKQKDLNDDVERTLLTSTDTALDKWLKALAAKHVRADGENSGHTRLRVHLDRYTARNTYDYFIHKDLGGFLRRELDFYIKNEVMHLDDVERERASRVEQYLSKIKVIRSIARKIIAFLAQLEDFQRKLWLKKKFVLETQYCITLDRVPAALLPEIAINAAQASEWKSLFDRTLTSGAGTDLTDEEKALVLDTRHFTPEFTARLIEGISDVDATTDGIALHSDNAHALALAQSRFAGAIQCCYIDPPFNTGHDFLYKDAYRFSSWLSFMESRLRASVGLLADSASQFLHLDYNANAYGRLLLDEVFGAKNFVNEIIWRIGWVSGYKTQVDAFVRNHDTLYFYAKTMKAHAFNKAQSRIPYQAFDRDSVDEELKSIMKKWGVDPRRVSNTKLSIKYPDGNVFKLGLTEKAAGYNIEDTWNSSEYEELNSNKIKRNAAEYTPHGAAITQKPEELLRRVIELTTAPRDWVLDYFGGSGTTAAVAWKLDRRFLTSETEAYFDDDLLWRLKKAMGGHVVGISKVVQRAPSGLIKYARLESYEDTLNNLELRRTPRQQAFLEFDAAQGPDRLKEQYVLRYMLDVESSGSQSLLNIADFTDPTAYKLKAKLSGSDESREVNVDLLETFNWLVGLAVNRLYSPQEVSAEFERDAEKRLRVKGLLCLRAGAPWWFRAVTGTTPDGQRAVIIWRKRPGGDDPDGIEQDNAVLNAWFQAQDFGTGERAPRRIWVNGTNNVENLKQPADQWTVALIEADFHRLMFAGEDR